MSLRYYLAEVYQHMRVHKSRSFLTGFGIMWGIFLLVVLLGSGAGFRDGCMRQMSGYAKNAVFFLAKTTKGGKHLHFDDKLFGQLKNHFPAILYVSPVICSGTAALQHNNKNCGGELRAAYRSSAKVDSLVLAAGRFFNARDEQEERQVCFLGNTPREELFDKRQSPIGQFISLDGHQFQVVGTLDKESAFNNDHQREVFIPLTTYRRLYGRGYRFWFAKLLLDPAVDAKKMEKRIQAYFAAQMGFDAKDKNAIRFWNISASYSKFKRLFASINAFLWLVSISLLLSSLVGISNMMLVTVKERTQEMAIRKVMGAQSRQILWLILCESIVITFSAGLLGMFSGMGVLQLANKVLHHIDPQKKLMMADLTFHSTTILVALCILAVASIIAGFIPARRATTIRPHEALNAI